MPDICRRSQRRHLVKVVLISHDILTLEILIPHLQSIPSLQTVHLLQVVLRGFVELGVADGICELVRKRPKGRHIRLGEGFLCPRTDRHRPHDLPVANQRQCG